MKEISVDVDELVDPMIHLSSFDQE